MPAIALRDDYDAARVRGFATRSQDAKQARRLLSIAAAYEGIERAAAARIGGMDRQTLRDWVHRFNEAGPEGLIDRKAAGAPPRLTPAQLAELARIVDAGPDPERDGVVRWRCMDLKHLIAERFGVAYHERSVGKLLAALGFAHISARPRHVGQDAAVMAAFKKIPGPSGGDRSDTSTRHGYRGLVPGRDARRSEERLGAAMGAQGIAPAPDQGPADRVGLPLRRHLPRARRGGGAGPTARQHRGHGSASQGNRARRRAGRPCRRAARSSRLAHHRQARHPREQLAHALAGQVTGTQSGAISSGNTCARTGFPTASSTATKPSSRPLAKPGTTSPTNPKRSCPSV